MFCWKRAGHKKTALQATSRRQRPRRPYPVKALRLCVIRFASEKLNYWDKPLPGFADRVMEQIFRLDDGKSGQASVNKKAGG
jgi:hypothetical protein